MRLFDYLHIDSIIPDLVSTDKQSVILNMAEKLFKADRIEDINTVNKALNEREKLGSTGIGKKVAIPHTKIIGISEIVALVAISHEGVEFNSLDGQKVNVFFTILAPPGESGKHLKLLARISRLVRLNGFCESLVKLESPQEIMDAIEKAEKPL